LNSVAQESARLSALRRYEILDTPPDGAFDRITAIAARLFHVPAAMVSLVDEDRIWFKSRYGLEVEQINRDEGLCASCILGEEVLAITNALEDPRCLANPLVAGAFGLRFYAGAPLRTHDGYGLGTLCVIDFQPRPISDAEQAQLRDLAAIVVDEMELRLAARRVAAYEEHARQAQKMEAISRLSGGIAHHFNNILTSTSGYLHLAMEQLAPSSVPYQYLQHVELNNERAAQLTRDFLIFSRKEALQSGPVPVNRLVTGVLQMLRPLLPDRIEVALELTADMPDITADGSQLEQALINLIINARDAMPEGGRLTLRTSVFQLSRERPHGPKPLPPGRYAMLTVMDTGHGIGAELRSRIFEPFFTTKEIGKGTGLGLSVAHAIVTQAGGTIEVDSEPGRGSAFSLLLPVAPAGVHSNGAPKERKSVLLVEDESSVRRLLATVLDGAGFRVLEARNGQQALETCANGEKLDLVITDLMMPVMGGDALMKRLAERHPHIPVLAMSGHAEETVAANAGRISVPLLKKPFGPPQLLAMVREVLAGTSGN
jgi:signal transduction histidine kinase/CheY-like chemotaxis protein